LLPRPALTIEFGSLSQFASLLLATNTDGPIPSLAVCALRNDGRFSLAHHGRQRSASHEFEKSMKCRASYSE
jgi:hypothetical protein